MRSVLAVCLMGLMPFVALGAPPGAKPVPDGVPGADEAPPITIRAGNSGRIVEYRANGQLYMLKIIPRAGRPYYLVDFDGRGQFVRRDTLAGLLQPPMWVIRRF